MVATEEAERPLPVIQETLRAGEGQLRLLLAGYDNHLDLVVSNSQRFRDRLSNGQFREARGSPFPGAGRPNDITVEDFDQDDLPDLAFTR